MKTIIFVIIVVTLTSCTSSQNSSGESTKAVPSQGAPVIQSSSTSIDL